MENKSWKKLTAHGKSEDSELLCALLSLFDDGLMIEDYSDLSPEERYGELLDEDIERADRTRCAVSVFLPEECDLAAAAAELRERLAALAVTAEVTTELVREEDWAENWKQYYHPIRIGRVTVVPAWEDYTPAEGERILRIDPGTAYGTGTHETTRMAMELVDEELTAGERFLDIGCGSGILSLLAAKLDASFCAAYDLDPEAVRVTRENIEKEGYRNIVCGVSDLLDAVDLSGGKYDFMAANIVADILIRMAPSAPSVLKEGGKLAVSGILAPHRERVREAIEQAGFTFLREKKVNDWHAMLFRRN